MSFLLLFLGKSIVSIPCFNKINDIPLRILPITLIYFKWLKNKVEKQEKIVNRRRTPDRGDFYNRKRKNNNCETTKILNDGINLLQ